MPSQFLCAKMHGKTYSMGGASFIQMYRFIKAKYLFRSSGIFSSVKSYINRSLLNEKISFTLSSFSSEYWGAVWESKPEKE